MAFPENISDSDQFILTDNNGPQSPITPYHFAVSAAHKQAFAQPKSSADIHKISLKPTENIKKTTVFRPSLIKQALKKAVTDNSHEGGFRKGLLMILLALLLFGLGYLFYTSLGVLGLIFYIIFGIAAAIYFIAGLITMLFG